MLDERWGSDAAELGAGLRALLDKQCDTAAVRAAEARPDGRDEALEERLAAFGLWQLPADAEILARAAWELGRALAPVPFAETAPVHAILGVEDASSGLEGPVPVPPQRCVVRDANGNLVPADVEAPPRRTSAGDLLSDVPSAAPGAEVVGDARAADRVRRLSRLLHAARIGGASERLFELGVAYAKTREQFGKPIGAFQAVAHRLADAAIAQDGATLLVRKAAWVADAAQGGDSAPSPIFATMVWAKLVDAGRFVASSVHQVMGGYGFTIEEDCQLFSRRIRSWSMRRSAPGAGLAELGRTLLDPARRDETTHLWHHDRGVPVPRWSEESDG